MIMHIITNFSSPEGAQTMLARLVSHSGEKAVVVSLLDICEQNIQMANNPNAVFEALEVNSSVAIPQAVWRLSRLIRKHKPDVILCWMYHAMVAGTLAAGISGTRTPVFWTVRQALDNPGAMSASTRAALSISRYLSRFCSGVIYNSHRASDQHQDFGFSSQNATVIHNGFVLPTTPHFSDGPPRVFGLAARFHPQKDFANLFAAAAKAQRKIPGLRFVLAGRGVNAENGELEKIMSESGVNQSQIQLCDQVQDMASFYSQIDALVLSSKTEGFPNVVAEAMAHGKPVVTTDVGDSASIVSGSGIVVPACDSNELANALVEMAKWSPEVYKEKCRRSYAKISENYNLGKIANDYNSVLFPSDRHAPDQMLDTQHK